MTILDLEEESDDTVSGERFDKVALGTSVSSRIRRAVGLLHVRRKSESEHAGKEEIQRG